MSQRYLTEEEIEKIRVQRGVARLSVAALEQRAGLRNQKLAEALRARVKMSETEIACVFSNLATSQPIAADKGHRMICTRCKKHLTDPGETKCRGCKGETNVTVEIIGKPVPPVVPQDPRITPAELASRIEHCMQELSRQGKRIISVQTDLDDRVSALAQALAAHEKSKAAPLSAAEGQPVRQASSDPDIIVSFVNFERVCRQMYAKCPHLFAATVRRACEGKP